MLNRQAILNGIESIKASDWDDFNMARYFWEAEHELNFNAPAYGTSGQNPDSYECGTPSCVAGHLLYAAGLYKSMDPHGDAQVLCGLTDWQAQDLFVPSARILECIKPEEAIETLEHLLETGKVRWPHQRGAMVDGLDVENVKECPECKGQNDKKVNECLNCGHQFMDEDEGII